MIIRPRASENAAAVPPGLPRMTKHSLGPNSSSFIVTYIEPWPVRTFLVTPVSVRGLPLRASASEEKVCPLPSGRGSNRGPVCRRSGRHGRFLPTRLAVDKTWAFVAESGLDTAIPLEITASAVGWR